MDEIWRAVPTMEGRYWVSNFGRVKSQFNRILKCNVSNGQKCVSIVICNKSKVFEVRHLMAYAFLDADIMSTTKPTIRHKDGNYRNIRLDNLEIEIIEDLENEHWKDIKGFEGVYQISDKGRVKRLAREEIYTRKDTGTRCIRRYPDRILRNSKSEDGYDEINLVHGSLSIYAAVHRLVAEAFIVNPENKPQVNHKDGVRNNNHVENLEWCTCIENVRDQINRSGRANCIAAIRQAQGVAIKCLETQAVFESIGQVSKILGCDNAAIPSSIERRTCCCGWTFVYLDTCESLNISEEIYMKLAQTKYFKWSRAKIKEVEGWTHISFREA